MPDPAQLAALAVLLGLTLYAAAVDFRSMIIPDRVNLAVFLCGIAASFLPGTIGPIAALTGAAVGGCGFLLLQAAFRAYRGYDGLGLGDVKFAAAAGAWTGVEELALALALASMSALAYLLVRKLLDAKFDARHPLPFGPFLGLGVVSVVTARTLVGMPMIDILDLWLLRLHRG
jgi:leader peptidase (prepilin peptidase)/N-methyltransferase